MKENSQFSHSGKAEGLNLGKPKNKTEEKEKKKEDEKRKANRRGSKRIFIQRESGGWNTQQFN